MPACDMHMHMEKKLERHMHMEIFLRNMHMHTQSICKFYNIRATFCVRPTMFVSQSLTRVVPRFERFCFKGMMLPYFAM